MTITLLEIGLSNALLATVLAAAAFVVTRRMRPNWALAIWLLVLAKLLMPPLWTAPLGSWRASAPIEEPHEFVSWSQDEQLVAFSTEEIFAAPDVQFEPLPLAEVVAEPPAAPLSISALLLSAWAVGTLCWGILAMRRIRGFSTLLKQTRAAPAALQAEVDALASEIGLRRVPELRVTRRRIGPLVWAFSRRGTILLPATLLEQLSAEERQALLLHELAHLRRRDHLTKLVELATVAIYWWLPTAWWARRQADRATEGCCDAEVVARLADGSRSYATALVKTIDFLSGPTEPLPLGASGFSQFRHVSRRIEMILQPVSVSRSLWRHRLALLALGAVVLPMSVSSLWADPPTPDIESEVDLPSPSVEIDTATEQQGDTERRAEYEADLAIESEGPIEYEESPQAKVIFPSGMQPSAELNIAEALFRAQYAAKTNAVLKHYFGKQRLQEARTELARLEQQTTEDGPLKMVEIRNHLCTHLATMEKQFASGEVSVRQLIDVQQQFADQEAALARAVCDRWWSGEVLRMQANYMIACEAVTRARKTWKAVHQQASDERAEPATEALAREHFYQCKQQFQNVAQAALGDFRQHVIEAGTTRYPPRAKSATLATEWRMFAVTDPITTGPQISKLEPPSDENVLKALARKLFADGSPPARGDIQIVKELRATYADEPRTYPEVGEAQRHHAIYKCTVGYVEKGDNEVVEVVYVDHQHLHRVSTSGAPGQQAAENAERATSAGGGEFELSEGNAKNWISNAGIALDKEAFEARTKALADHAKVHSPLTRANAERREATARQVAAMETAYNAGTVTIDQLLEAQRRHSEAQVSYYQTILQSDSDSDEHRRLLHEANVIVTQEAMNSARRTWQKVYAKYRRNTSGSEAAVEAQAREQFYQFKSEYERARRDYQQSLDGRTSANQEPNSQSSHQTGRENEKSFQAEMNRVSVAGPLTTGKEVTALDPPSDDEVVRALADQNSKVFRSLQGENHRIVKELVATYTDPPKWHPKLFGKGQLHHAHYKCTIYYDDTEGKPQEEVAYVDHNHLHQQADSRSFEEFQSGPFHYTLARGITKEIVQFRHFQLQLAREKAKLADLEEQVGKARTAEQDTELARLQQDVAVRQHKLDMAARRVLQHAINPGHPTQKQ